MTRVIKIIPVLNGWIVECGCQKVVFTDVRALCNKLQDYYRAPEEIEERFLKEAINKPWPELTGPPGAVTPTCPPDRPPQETSLVPRNATDAF